MRKILIATHNPAKKEEIKKFLSDLPFEFVTLDEVGITTDVEETGKTFEENAVLKATFYAKASGLPTIADDGGIEIDALGGEPGVKSKRWIGGIETSDEDLVVYTMKRMEGIPLEKRGAQMRLVAAFATPDKLISTGEGIVRGIIAEKPSSSPLKKGFPFRQVFFIPEIISITIKKK
jgi:XTP/dITP diphosphohydrolase